PSYLPLPLLRRFALESPEGPWDEIAANTVKMVKASAPKGFAPDWIGFASSLDQAGPMARSAEDCALLLSAMSGFD
ncbi:hypothetical protein ACVBEH_32545, partial [Roseateles sp. GG27B]